MDIHLDEMEQSLLLQIIKNRLKDLRSEIHHEHNSESREYLKHKETLLNRILEKFPENADETAHERGFRQSP